MLHYSTRLSTKRAAQLRRVARGSLSRCLPGDCHLDGFLGPGILIERWDVPSVRVPVPSRALWHFFFFFSSPSLPFLFSVVCLTRTEPLSLISTRRFAGPERRRWEGYTYTGAAAASSRCCTCMFDIGAPYILRRSSDGGLRKDRTNSGRGARTVHGGNRTGQESRFPEALYVLFVLRFPIHGE
ncbi:hypothetical protein LZ32DRAFT_390796 [Colletotrichum eremochloae]|nr:hypothetical protein LZ32DRAFT_390796 [Colletotrichum eremochloae]